MNASTQAGLSFGRRSEDYKKFRLSYPDDLIERILAAMPTDRRDQAIDLGAGTGHTTKPLLPHFRNVMAIEPDAAMAERIDRADNLEVLVARGEDAEVSLQADLVTCGTAFYWMDGPLVLDRIAGWLQPDGLAAIYRYALPDAPPGPQQILLREMADHWDQFRNDRLRDEQYTTRTVAGSAAFGASSVVSVPNRHRMTAEAFVGFFGSTSYVGAYLRTLSDPEAYLATLTEEVAAAEGGEFEIDFPIELVLLTSPHR
jgi:hypothetical protein